MKTIWLPSLIALALGASAGTPAVAQIPPACPPGYYLYTDGRCYPGPQPVYPQPDYDVIAPVYQPPVVYDGFALGIGFGGGRGDRGHGGGARGGSSHGAARGHR
jgi:hypothetical protein